MTAKRKPTRKKKKPKVVKAWAVMDLMMNHRLLGYDIPVFWTKADAAREAENYESPKPKPVRVRITVSP